MTGPARSIESSLGHFTMSYGGIGDRPSMIRMADLEATQQSWQIKAPREQAQRHHPDDAGDIDDRTKVTRAAGIRVRYGDGYAGCPHPEASRFDDDLALEDERRAAVMPDAGTLKEPGGINAKPALRVGDSITRGPSDPEIRYPVGAISCARNSRNRMESRPDDDRRR